VAHPIVTVEVGGETFTAQARVTEGAERERLIATLNPQFIDVQARTSRVIPVVVLERVGDRDVSRQGTGPSAVVEPPIRAEVDRCNW
jgi:hypothetical protein